MRYFDIFPAFSSDELIEEIDNQQYFNVAFVSIFDHWLTTEEADSMIVSYSKKNPLMLKKYHACEGKFMRSLNNLYEECEIYNIKDQILLEAVNFEFKRPLSIEMYKKICKDSLREKDLFLLAIPHRSSILIGNFDLMVVVLTLKGASNEQIEICKSFTTNDLFIISDNNG